jgi:Na+-transporting NADH:ubiquinone oxidoreductase subunit NqrD
VWNTFNIPYKELNVFLQLSITACQVLSTTEENISTCRSVATFVRGLRLEA